ncbi:TetR/AcrR family transcriptional regulator [Streptomyces corynorhini]|uniref:TetR/AcrR family transcriptional regulator n=1 Tax=Streptomyces corynorhini TaxID=2282652 RepID=A0A370BDM7_9ACTN|nr:TetR/AcrR family transcriptional regulator [Streptomyces corynorhini]RDG37806.1 TetR/AcrR family transcriptional regulator [Streptomyces corynorhini]
MNTAAFLAYVDGRRLRWELVLDHCAQTAGKDPRTQLLAVFDALAEWAHAPCDGFRSNAFVNARVALAEPGSVIRAVVTEHKQALRARMLTLAEAAGARDPGLLVDQLLLIFEGAVSTRSLGTVEAPAEMARHTADQLIAAAVAQAPVPRGIARP